MLSIYLDQNKWIDLAKAIHRRDAKPEERETAEYLESLVRQEVVRFPVSLTHLMETSRIGDPARRIQLAVVLTQFSNGWFLASRQARIAQELEFALAQLLSVEQKRESCMFSRDMLLAIADYPLLSSLLSRSAAELKRFSAALGPEVSLRSFLAFEDEDSRWNAIQKMTQSNNELLNRIRARRERLSGDTPDLRFRTYSALLFRETQDKLAAALTKLGRTFDDLRRLSDEQIRSLVDSVPCLDVERSLALQLEKQRSRDLQGNDVYDIAFLTGAIPYCQAVVTEKLWVHLSRAAGIDRRYKTIVLSSLSELRRFLEAEPDLTGCCN